MGGGLQPIETMLYSFWTHFFSLSSPPPQIAFSCFKTYKDGVLDNLFGGAFFERHMHARSSESCHSLVFFLLFFFSFLPFLFRAAMAIGKVISIIAKFLQRAPSPIQSLQLKLLKNFEEKKRKKKKKERRLTPKQRKEIEGDSYFCT